MSKLSFLVLLSLLVLSACSSNSAKQTETRDLGIEENKMTKNIVFTDKQGTIISTVSDAKTVEKIAAIIEDRSLLLEKILPMMDYRINIQIDGKTQEWQYSKKGYIKDNSVQGASVYKIENPKLMYQLLTAK